MTCSDPDCTGRHNTQGGVEGMCPTAHEHMKELWRVNSHRATVDGRQHVRELRYRLRRLESE